MSQRRPIILQWGVSSFFGWGIYGLNLALNWLRDPDLAPAFSVPIVDRDLTVDRLRRLALEPVLVASRRIAADLARKEGAAVELAVPVVHGLGNGFETGRSAHQTQLRGKPTLGVAFIENTVFNPTARKRAQFYPMVVAGSSWNAALLRNAGVPQVETVLQGIDPTLFHPAPRLGLFKDKFVVFSGGKLEYRKGQDLVIKAFKLFAERHQDAMLATAWHSPFPQSARTMDRAGLAPVTIGEDNRANVRAWAQANGIPANRFIDLGAVPNRDMPQVLREMDVALFPNRCEGGTNLVAMECIACGVPTILSNNTGHKDLIARGGVLALNAQAHVPAPGPATGTDGWGESEVDEIVAVLDRAYQQNAEARETAAKGAEAMSALTWAAAAEGLKRAIMPYLK